MATHADLLSAGWGNGVNQYILSGSDFGSDDSAFAGALTWLPGNPQPKPTLQDVEARRTELEEVIVLKARHEKWLKELYSGDTLVLLAKVLALAVDEMQAKLRSQSLTSPLSAQTQNQIDTLLARIAQIEAIT